MRMKRDYNHLLNYSQLQSITVSQMNPNGSFLTLTEIDQLP